MKLLDSAFCFIHLVCVYTHIRIFSFLLLSGTKELKEFIIFPLATGSASASILSFVPSEENLLSNFSNHWLPLAAAPVVRWINPS